MMLLRDQAAGAAGPAIPHPAIDAGAMNADDSRDFRDAAELRNDVGCWLHALTVAHIATIASTGVAKSPTDSRRDLRYAMGMSRNDEIGQWVAKALADSGAGQAEIARRLTEMLGRSIDRAAVNKMVRGGRAVAADEMLAISAAAFSCTRFEGTGRPDAKRRAHFVRMA